ncbi:MAG: LytR C-terminal domain-containing protein [Candidatus Levyibacteriota bacterium]
MTTGSVVFSKIAATPTETAWSQAYSAGKLFTVLSLKKGEAEEESPEGENLPASESLKALGKNILDALETEFFSLEEKNLESVKTAIAEASKGIPENTEFSFVTTVLAGNILYSYIVGKGKVFIKREDKFGYVLESEDASREISSASGFLQNGDLVILATEDFSEAVSKDQLVASLDSLVPSEIAENLAPAIHESDEAGAAAIILSYKEDAKEHGAAPAEEDKEINTISRDADVEKANEESESKKLNPLGFIAPLFTGIGKLIPERLSHSKKVYLTVAAIILLVLIVSVLLGIKRQNDAKIEAAFNSVYPVAQKKFDEGESLKDLNKNLAMDSFAQAKKLLEESKDKFPQGSEQEKQVSELLAKVNKEIEANAPSQGSENLDKSKITLTVQNGSGAEGAAGTASDFLSGKGYKVSGTSNADNYKYEGVTIRVKKDIENYLETLKKDLSENYTVGKTSADLPTSSPTDVVVIIGK